MFTRLRIAWLSRRLQTTNRSQWQGALLSLARIDDERALKVIDDALQRVELSELDELLQLTAKSPAAGDRLLSSRIAIPRACRRFVEGSRTTKIEAANALAAIPDPVAVGMLMNLAYHPQLQGTGYARGVLERVAVDLLLRGARHALDSEIPEARHHALGILTRSGHCDAPDLLVSALTSPTIKTRIEVAIQLVALSGSTSQKVVADYDKAVGDLPRTVLQEVVSLGLRYYPASVIKAVLRFAIGHSDKQLFGLVLDALNSGPMEAQEVIAEELDQSSDPRARDNTIAARINKILTARSERERKAKEVRGAAWLKAQLSSSSSPYSRGSSDKSVMN